MNGIMRLRGQSDFLIFRAAANQYGHPAHRESSQQRRQKPCHRIPEPYGSVALTIVGESELGAMVEVTFEIAFKLSGKSRAIEHSVHLVIDAEAPDVDVC